MADVARPAILVLDALRKRPHPTHCLFEQALGVVARLEPERALFTHMCHDLPHAATCARLPPSVQLAYDGLTFRSISDAGHSLS